MNAERRAKLFSNGGNRAIRIPEDFEFDGDGATIRKDGDRLIVEPVRKGSLLEALAGLEPLEERLPDIDDAAELRFGVENRKSDRLRRQVDAVRWIVRRI